MKEDEIEEGEHKAGNLCGRRHSYRRRLKAAGLRDCGMPVSGYPSSLRRSSPAACFCRTPPAHQPRVGSVGCNSPLGLSPTSSPSARTTRPSTGGRRSRIEGSFGYFRDYRIERLRRHDRAIETAAATFRTCRSTYGLRSRSVQRCAIWSELVAGVR